MKSIRKVLLFNGIFRIIEQIRQNRNCHLNWSHSGAVFCFNVKGFWLQPASHRARDSNKPIACFLGLSLSSSFLPQKAGHSRENIPSPRSSIGSCAGPGKKQILHQHDRRGAVVHPACTGSYDYFLCFLRQKPLL